MHHTPTTPYRSALDRAQDRLDQLGALIAASAADPESVGGPQADAPTTTADQLDQITGRLDQLRGDLYRAVRALPDRALPAVWMLATATDHLRAAAVALGQATDQIEAIGDQRQAVIDAADDAWADPSWQVDSATRTCCGGIGSHTQECTAQPVGYMLTDAAVVALN